MVRKKDNHKAEELSKDDIIFIDFIDDNSENLKPTVRASKHRVPIKCGKDIVIYPLIYEASKFTTDDFWKGLFEELSVGKYPKCVYISNNTLYSTNKRKQFTYLLIPDDKTPQEIAEELYTLLVNNTNLCSNLDNNNRKAQIQSEKISLKDITKWSAIKKKNIKEQLIVNYVLKMRKVYQLTWTATRHLFNLIHSGFIYHTQLSTDVEFADGEIKSIDGIVYNEHTKYFMNERYSDQDWIDEPENTTQKYFSYYWRKYILTMAKPID